MKNIYKIKRFGTWQLYAKHLISLKSTSKTNKGLYEWAIINNENPFTDEVIAERIIFHGEEYEADCVFLNRIIDLFDRNEIGKVKRTIQQVSPHMGSAAKTWINVRYGFEVIHDDECEYEIMEAEEGSERAQKILDSEVAGKYPEDQKNFIYKSGNKYITVFNETSDCWIEEFHDIFDAIAYMVGDTDAEGNDQA